MSKPETISIDNKDYVLQDLSDGAKTQLVNLGVVDKEIARLQ